MVFKFAVHLGLRETLFSDWTHCTITNVFPKNGRFAGGLEPGMLCNSAINAQNSGSTAHRPKKVKFLQIFGQYNAVQARYRDIETIKESL